MFDGLNEIVVSAIVVLIGGAVCTFLGRSIGIRPAMAAFLYAWHTLIGAYLSAFVLMNGGDALAYYMRAKFALLELKPGTDFIPWLTSFPVGIGLTYWPCAFLYNIAGAAGLIFYYAALQETPAGQNRSPAATFLFLACTLIPSLSLWTAAIGKDSLALLSVGMLLWATMGLEHRNRTALAAVATMFIVRPHISALMLVAIGTGVILTSEVRRSVRLGIAASAAGVAAFAVPFALIYSGTARFDTFKDYVAERQGANLGGSSIDITQMNPAMRVVSFLYRPFPNEASGFEQLASSADNMALLALTIFGLVVIYRAGLAHVFRRYPIAAIYGISCLLLLSQVTGNLGLATRQKWMCIPPLLLLFAAAWGLRRTPRQPHPTTFAAVRQPQQVS